MSTICKLDRNVRLDRMLRKMALRELRGDVANADRKYAQGLALLMTAPNSEAERNVTLQLTNLLRFKIISEMNLTHLEQVSKDPRRTGVTKEAIFHKLGMEARA